MISNSVFSSKILSLKSTPDENKNLWVQFLAFESGLLILLIWRLWTQRTHYLSFLYLTYKEESCRMIAVDTPIPDSGELRSCGQSQAQNSSGIQSVTCHQFLDQSPVLLCENGFFGSWLCPLSSGLSFLSPISFHIIKVLSSFLPVSSFFPSLLSLFFFSLPPSVTYFFLFFTFFKISLFK